MADLSANLSGSPETVNLSDSVTARDLVSMTTGTLRAGIYDVTVGGGAAAAAQWSLIRNRGTGTTVLDRCRFYTAANNAFFSAQLRIKVEEGDVLQLVGPNRGVLNAVIRWV